MIIIPGGLTRYLQSFDVLMNKPFKEEIRRKYNEYCIKSVNIKVSQKKMIDWVEEIWCCGKLTSAVISKSYKRIWVTLNLGSSVDELFIGFN